jgi:formylmethanofuran dehydrogenase subunit E
MVAGIRRFRDHFAGHEDQYILIGGAACELIMDEVGLDFRATKDLDIVLIVEALDPAFSETFWAFIEERGL